MFGTKRQEKEGICLFGVSIPYQYAAALLLLIGVAARIWMLGEVPGGLNQDEAFSGYEAYSLLHYGKDSAGYSFPVYLVAWGSGMNVLNSYLMIPFMAVFGAQAWVVRLPQVLTACFSLLVMYRLFKRLFHERAALTGLLFMAVCPWHIMMSRWGLESNLAPGFLLFGVYFFLLGVEKPRYFLLSALFYGLSLYCYATIWPIVPLILLLQFLYLLWTKKLQVSRWLIGAVVILFLLALPLLLFLLVNGGYMEEIKTPFLSVPKLAVMRDSEISLANIWDNLQNMFRILTQENDGLYWNTTEEYGLYYRCMLPAGFIGLLYCIKRMVVSLKERTFDGVTLMIVNLFSALVLGCLISVNVNRINCIHIPIIFFIGVGLWRLVDLLRQDLKHFCVIGACALMLLFVFFENFYFTTYRENIAGMFQEGLEQAVDYALEEAGEDGQIYVASGISYSKVLFYSEMPVDRYTDTVQYTNYPAAFLDVASCGNFHFNFTDLSGQGVYIITADAADAYGNAGYEVECFGKTAVVKIGMK